MGNKDLFVYVTKEGLEFTSRPREIIDFLQINLQVLFTWTIILIDDEFRMEYLLFVYFKSTRYNETNIFLRVNNLRV